MTAAAHFQTGFPGSLTQLAHKGRRIAEAHPYAAAAVATAGALAMLALVNRRLARNAESDNPPAGQFLEVGGVRLHYVERGSGPALRADSAVRKTNRPPAFADGRPYRYQAS